MSGFWKAAFIFAGIVVAYVLFCVVNEPKPTPPSVGFALFRRWEPPASEKLPLATLDRLRSLPHLPAQPVFYNPETPDAMAWRSVAPANAMLVRITNDLKGFTLLNRLIVETNSATGWQTFRDTAPWHRRMFGPGGTNTVLIQVPGDGQPWRLRVTYDWDSATRGLGRLLADRWHDLFEKEFRLRGGTGSCISAEMTR